jgi:hypothetical protein
MQHQNVFDRASAHLDIVKSPTSIQTEIFLNICREVIPVISKFLFPFNLMSIVLHLKFLACSSFDHHLVSLFNH